MIVLNGDDSSKIKYFISASRFRLLQTKTKQVYENFRYVDFFPVHNKKRFPSFVDTKYFSNLRELSIFTHHKNLHIHHKFIQSLSFHGSGHNIRKEIQTYPTFISELKSKIFEVGSGDVMQTSLFPNISNTKVVILLSNKFSGQQ
jgi:hypothetical protein